MKNKRTAIYLSMTLLLTMTGCGNSDGISDVSTTEIMNFDTIAGTDTQQSTDEQIDTELHNNEQGNIDQQQSVSELDGSVESIGNNSVVINKAFHPSENIVAMFCEDDEKVLVTVYFSDDTTFEVRNVRNSGVNGDSDVETQAGTFSDIKEQLNIKMTGSYVGSDFYATQVFIYHYI